MTRMQPSHRIHTIFGAGQIGRLLANQLLARGIDVRVVRRGEPGPEQPGLTWLRGDITRGDFARRAAEGAEVVYHCTNPAQYHRWDELLPPLYRATADAAAHAGARLVTLDNVYMYGDPEGTPMTEDTEMAATTRKGALRARLFTELRERGDRGDFHLTTGRASDFFGPGATLGAVFSLRAYERLAAGRAVEVMGDPDAVHSYSYIPDVARGLAILGTQPVEHGSVYHLPVSFSGSTRELLDRIARELGHPGASVRRIPTWFLRAAGRLVPVLSAAAEMVYQWEGPFVVDDTRFRTTYGAGPTPAEEAVRSTAAWVKAHVLRSAA